MLQEHESLAWQIQEFIWEGRPYKSKKREHTPEEYWEFLEELRQQCWDNYNRGAEYLGWK